MPKNKNVLVTGGAGYIGSHTCKVLKSNNFNPVTYDNLSSGRKDFVKWGPLVIGELNDKNKIIKTIKKYKIKSIIHLAAKSIIEDSESDKTKYFKNNLYGTIALLDAMKECKIKKIIFSSTAAVYGDSSKSKIRFLVISKISSLVLALSVKSFNFSVALTPCSRSILTCFSTKEIAPPLS